jgi:hypothetical protein
MREMTFLADDAVPDTLLAVLRVVANDFMPETRASAEFVNQWLAEHAPKGGTPAVGRLAEAPGSAAFVVNGQHITALAQPYRHFQLQRVHQLVSALADRERSAVMALLDSCGFGQLLSMSLKSHAGARGQFGAMGPTER